MNNPNYQIIADESAVQNFIDTILPLSNSADETFYLSLFARKKYAPELIWSNDKTQLKRLTANRNTIIQKLRQLEIKLGTYTLGDRIVPQESLVMYIHPNPRSQKKAAIYLLKKLADLIGDNAQGYNVHQEALSAIQNKKSISKKVYIDFDFDVDKTMFPSLIASIYSYVNSNAVTLVETRGGLHALIKSSLIQPEFKNTWYKNIQQLGADVQGDCMIPIPGTFQGGFVPKIIKNE